MNKYLLLLISLSAIIFACKESDPYSPAKYLSDRGAKKVIRETIRLSTKLPPGATHKNKYDTTFNAYYAQAEKEYDLRYWLPTDSCSYFLMTRMARSITPMREGIGGKIKYDETGTLKAYEELFRTWKMSDSLLQIRGKELFEAMIKQKDLTPYTTKYRGDQYIEFPDERFFYDKKLQQWRDSELDSLNLN